jgi:elongation factor Tu
MKKIHVNVGTIGHVDHGKTTLTAALTHVSARRFGGTARDYGDIDKSPEERDRGITIHATHVEYESARRHYAHIDCPGHADYVKNMIVGASQMDGAVVLVDATQGVGPQTHEHVLLARQVGVEHLIVFINKIDVAEADLVDVVEVEAIELLERHGYKNVPVVRGSALRALEAAKEGVLDDERAKGVLALLEALDAHVPDPVRDEEAPFLMPIEDVFHIEGRGTVVTGRVGRGVLALGDEIELLGDPTDHGKRGWIVVVTGIETFRRPQTEARAGENVGLLLRGVHHTEVERGLVAAKPGSIAQHKDGVAELYVLGAGEGGRKKPFGTGYRPQFFFGATDVTGTILVGDAAADAAGNDDGAGVDLVFPGDRARVKFTLDRPVGFEAGMRFALREGGRTVGAGRIV